MYRRSIEDPAGFWSEIASQFYWTHKWGDEVYSENLDVTRGPIKIEVRCLVFTCLSISWMYFSSLLLHPLIICIFSSTSSGSRVVLPTFPIIAWTEMSKPDLVTKLLSTGKAMSLVLMPL